MEFNKQRNYITFEEFYERSYKLLLCVAKRLLRNQLDAEEIVQDVYCKIAGDFDKYSRMSFDELRNISCTMTRNSSLNLLKKKSIHKEVLCEVNEELMGYKDYVEDSFFEKYEKECIKMALGSLKNTDLEILVLKYYDELSYAEIAKSLSTSIKNVEIKLRRARMRLKEVLEDEYGYGK